MLRLILIVLPFLFCYASDAQINMNQGLMLYLPFNGDATDASGNNNHGVVNGATLANDEYNTPFSAYYFDGVDDEITILNSPTLNHNTMTVCAKVKMQGYYNGFCYNNVILNKGNDYWSSPVSNYSLRTTATNTNGDCNLQDTSNHNYRFDVNGNGNLTMNQLNTSPHVVTNSWDCLVGTFDGTTRKLYVNGTLRYQNTVPLKPFNTSPLTLGWHADNPLYPFWFNGVIDEVRIYNRVLSTEELDYYCKIPFPESTSNNIKQVEFQIIPNPTTDFITIHGQLNFDRISIFNVDGRQILTQEKSNLPNERIDVSNLANGLYYLKLHVNNTTYSTKFIKN